MSMIKKDLSAPRLRELIRDGQWETPTTGAAPGYVQANLAMLPRDWAFHFLLFCVRNPKPCPILDVLEPGQWEPRIAKGADLRTDLPRYRVYREGELERETEDVTDLFGDHMVSFLLGCSFSFESALIAAGVPVRNLEEEKNVSMYITNRDCITAGPFSAPLVVSMRPMTPEQAVRAVQVTTRFHLTHGAPVHLGAPEEIGVSDLGQPDFGDPVTLLPGEIPVFWACGVTTILAATSTDLPLVITHAPGHMFVSDLRDEDLTLL
ncbi:MAG: putative hydro-lyase [Proteobacteria bacterium]|nr:putative hydro-lyase [Desulfobacterales bacterium]MBL6967164.1 putative hydro-lyase [Desulfobacteraceae bacterium]MBL7172565.1 putative hydro-lyase [Desulfobacteraceae bacterium]MBU0735373.1 putative hydro-lyase [Pseudomonadota bacterium]MBU1902710.1 putative hydro-lyase [Pseudomonadota bacterium]